MTGQQYKLRRKIAVIVTCMFLSGCIWSKPIKEDAPPPPIVSAEQWEECNKVKTRPEWDEKQCSGNWPLYW
ncbi:hypothetical protein LCGC14_1595730 [marine sediment metagenome]|uniref:Lipoprotein n=1 Tax=marine sediment metagenome TaxID=412755 RepID=A0A0F9ID14_9ZZZZ